MACSIDRQGQIADLAVGRIDADAARELLEHVATCRACSVEFDDVADLCGAAERDPELLSSPASRGMRRPLWFVLAAAAALCAAMLLWKPFGHLLESESEAIALAALASTEALPSPWIELRAGEPPARAGRYTVAMAAYGRGEFEAAARALGELASAAPEDALVQLYLGITLLQVDRPAAAVPALGAAARHGEGLLQERALWYLANAQLGLGDGPAALRTLQALRDLGGDYEANAIARIAAVRDVLARSRAR